MKVELISTCPPDDRVLIAKENSILQEMEPDSENVKVAENVERYAKQPSQLEDWCLADYVAQLDVQTRTSNTVQHDTEDSSSAENESTTCSNTLRTQQDIVQMQEKQNHLIC